MLNTSVPPTLSEKKIYKYTYIVHMPEGEVNILSAS